MAWYWIVLIVLFTLLCLLFLAYMTNADMKLIEKLYDALIKYHDSKTVEEYVLENGYYPAKTTVTVEKDKDSKDYGKICAVSVVLSEKKEQQISVEQIVIGESTEEKKQEISQDYSTLRNELAQLLHITISCVEVKQKSR